MCNGAQLVCPLAMPEIVLRHFLHCFSSYAFPGYYTLILFPFLGAQEPIRLARVTLIRFFSFCSWQRWLFVICFRSCCFNPRPSGAEPKDSFSKEAVKKQRTESQSMIKPSASGSTSVLSAYSILNLTQTFHRVRVTCHGGKYAGNERKFG